jgi:hypothetical protein
VSAALDLKSEFSARMAVTWSRSKSISGVNACPINEAKPLQRWLGETVGRISGRLFYGEPDVLLRPGSGFCLGQFGDVEPILFVYKDGLEEISWNWRREGSDPAPPAITPRDWPYEFFELHVGRYEVSAVNQGGVKQTFGPFDLRSSELRTLFLRTDDR